MLCVILCHGITLSLLLSLLELDIDIMHIEYCMFHITCFIFYIVMNESAQHDLIASEK